MELKNVQKESLVGLFNETYKKTDWKKEKFPFKNEPIKKEEKVLGVMTDWEKAMFKTGYDFLMAAESKEEIDISKTIKRFMFDNIRFRLKIKTRDISIRKGWQIVKIKKNNMLKPDIEIIGIKLSELL